MTDVEVPDLTSQPNADRPNHGGYPASIAAGGPEANFLLWREVDRLERSIEAHGRRMEYLDEHGSRGVDALKGQIEQIRKDFLEHEGTHAESAKLAREAATAAATARRWMIGVIIALVTPLYPVLFVLWGMKG
jgi:hypothetical protein